MNGANRDRTGDLLLAKQALSQLSYGPATPNIGDAVACPAAGKQRPERPGSSARDPGTTGIMKTYLPHFAEISNQRVSDLLPG